MYAEAGLLTLRALPAAFPDFPVARGMASACAACALTVAGQWRILTAFPNTSCIGWCTQQGLPCAFLFRSVPEIRLFVRRKVKVKTLVITAVTDYSACTLSSMTFLAALTQGLYPFEIVLLFGGIVLLIILLAGLVAGLIRGKIPSMLVSLFIIAILMIAYPSVQSIKYKDLTVTLNDQLKQMLQNPTDPNVRNNVAELTNKVAARPTSVAATVATLASAQYALGKQQPAQENLNKALQLDPQQPTALELKSKIVSVGRLQQLTSTVQREPVNGAARQQLEEAAAEVDRMPLANPQALTSLAKAQQIMGNEEAAQQTEKKAMAIRSGAFKR